MMMYTYNLSSREGVLKYEDHVFEASLGYIIRPDSKKNITITIKKKT